MKTLTKTTHIATIRQKNQSQTSKVCQLLNWSEEQYCNYLFEQYCDFVKRMFYRYPVELYQTVLYSPVMRGLWNNEVFKRNALDFLPFASAETEPMLEFTDDVDGIFCLPACKPGAAHIVDEFMLIHAAARLVHDDEFMIKYNNVLSLIRKEEQC